MSNKPLINNLRDAATLDQALAKKIAGILREAITQRGVATLAVSGGGTPRAMLQLLAAQALDWSRVQLLLVDERWLPEGHKDRNETMLRATLLQGQAAACQYVPLKSADERVEDGQFVTEEALDDLPWPLDVVHLGMGSDGHTASWFHDAPEYPQLQQISRQRCIAIHPNSAPYPRLSLTPAAVFDSRHIFVHLTGNSKREVLEQALFKGADYPIALVLKQKQVPVEVYWAP